MTLARTNVFRLTVAGTLALSVAAPGCSELTIIGISAKQTSGTITPASAPRGVTEIAAVSGELIQPYAGDLGDIDGDGFDDFLIGGTTADPEDYSDRMTVYLFYGRPVFADQLVSTDADATFESRAVMNFALGDINGDGLADFVLQDHDGYELVFGSKTRLTGHHTKFSTGSVLTHPAEFGPDGLVTSGIEAIKRLGDLNGDGKDDFSVTVVLPDDEHGNLWGTGLREYIIEGRAEGWPTGAWNASYAAAELGPDVDPDTHRVNAFLSIADSGDIDGDGYADLLVYANYTTLVYYGSAAGVHGTLRGARADAELDFGQTDFPLVLGDLDSDGAEELLVTKTNSFNIIYGSRTRYAGLVQPKADFAIIDRGPHGSTLVADINGDALPDLLFVANNIEYHIDTWEEDLPISTRLYVMHGTGKRVTGEQRGMFTEYRPVGYPAPAVLQTGGFAVWSSGDFDADGSADLVLGAPGQEDPADSAVLLLPGTMRQPE